MDKLRSMRVFEKVVAESGFAAAARKLHLSPAVVTRLVADLEGQLGVRLLQRTTRRLSLTAAGKAYVDRVRVILNEIEQADDEARHHAQEMTGSVRVMALPGMATHLVAPAVAEFHRQHPGLTIELNSDAMAARAIETSDITLLTDQVALPGSAVVRRVTETASILCASPAYLRQHGEPRTPQELQRHAVIRLSLEPASAGPWQLTDETDPGRQASVAVTPLLTCNDHEAALRCTLEGVGISSQTLQVVAPLLRSGKLQRVLAPWVAERFALVAAFASRRYVPARTRAFLDHLIRSAAPAQAAAKPPEAALAPMV